MSAPIAAKLVGGAAAQVNRALRNIGPRIRICSPFGGMYAQSSAASNGTTQTSGTDLLQFVMNGDYANLSAVLINGSPASGSGNIGKPGNAVKFFMGLQQGSLTVPMPFSSTLGAPVSTGGETAYVLANGAIDVSRPISGVGTLAAGSTQAIRFYKSVSAGEKWPLTYGTGNYNFISTGGRTTDPVAGSSVVDGSDQSYQTSPAWGNYTSPALIWAPLAFIGEQVNPVPVVMVTGDSISAGFAEAAGRGYIVRGLEAAGIAYHNDGVISTTTFNITNNMYGARQLTRYVDYVIVHIGTNDLATGAVTTLAAFQTALLNVAKAYGRDNNQILFATVLPRPGSNGTAAASYASQVKPAYEDLRVQINNWTRDKTSNGMVAQINAQLKVSKVLGVFDPCVQLERNWDGTTATPIVLDGNGQQTAGTGGYFLINMSTDATHPNAAGAALAAASVPTQLLTLPLVA